VNVLLVAVALAFAWSIGAHYTGACMGMPHALGAIDARRALMVMAPLALLGAALASHGVERTVALRLTDRRLHVAAEVVVVAVAFALTSIYNRLRIPTSTIQILVFSLLGTALATGAGVRWARVGVLAILWAAAPLCAFLLGLALTRLIDRLIDRLGGRLRGGRGGALAQAGQLTVRPLRAGAQAVDRSRRGHVLEPLGGMLVLVGAVASFAMGGNDVANATGPLVGARVLSPLLAGTLGGIALAVGVLSYGRPLLTRVAFEIVQVDRAMATVAQGVQGAVVLAAVAFGLFTSMNQALVGAMAGAGLARGRRTVELSTLTSILRGWLLGPAAGIGMAFVIAHLAIAAGASLS